MESPSIQTNWKKDKYNICLLLYFYILQGIPIGLAGSIPLIIQTFNVSWSQQAIFSFVFWPFSLKILWAPIVDGLYSKRFGRRKTWLIPIQYLIGTVLIILSYNINNLLHSIKTETNNQTCIYFLTSIFIVLSFLSATQDICVDGWAISMLSKENVGWASICNSVGQTIGYFIGNAIFLALDSTNFSNSYIRKPLNMTLQSTGLVSFSDFLSFWGFIFIISTTLIAVLKHETDEYYDSDESYSGVIEAYRILVQTLLLPSVRSIGVILLTARIGFAAIDAMTPLELTDRGLSKELLAFLGIPIIPIQIIVPFLISKYTNGPKPLNVYLKSYPLRLLVGVFISIFVYCTPLFRTADGKFSWSYYILAVVIYGIHQVFSCSMFVSLTAFFAKVSDVKIGGTYMTLLSTLANLGASWTSTVALYAADYLTWGTCSSDHIKNGTVINGKNCTVSGGVSHIYIDSYYIEVFICTIVGIIWLLWRCRSIIHLQNLPLSAWKVQYTRSKSKSCTQ